MNSPPDLVSQGAAGLGSDDRTEDKSPNDTAATSLAQLIQRRRVHLAIAEGLPDDSLLNLATQYLSRGFLKEAVWTLRLLVERVQGVQR